MNNGHEDSRSGWEPLGWELEGPPEQSDGSGGYRSYGSRSDGSGGAPVPRAAEAVEAAEMVAWGSPGDRPPPVSRNPSGGLVVASVLLAVLGLIGIGIGIAEVFFDRSTPAPQIVVPASEAVEVSGPQVVSASPDQPSPLQVPVPTVPPMPSVGDADAGDRCCRSDQSEVLLEPVVRVARAVSPSVVLIESIANAGDRVVPPLIPRDPGNDPESPEQPPRVTGQGSGIIYDASGLILTNAHVVGESEKVRVQFDDGTRVEGTVVGTAPAIDVALVRVDTDKVLTPAVFADLSTVEVGQLAVAVGSPFGLQQSVTSGVVSSSSRAVREGTDGDAYVEMIQTDAPINPGNSGGPLANRLGQVIGMNTLIQTDGSIGNIGLGFAIPSDIVLNIAQRILDGESTELGYLGILGNNPEMGHPGALVLEVIPDTPADRAGMMDGDLIVLFDNEVVTNFTGLAAKIQFRVPGTEVEMEVVRDDVHVTLTVVIGSLADAD